MPFHSHWRLYLYRALMPALTRGVRQHLTTGLRCVKHTYDMKKNVKPTSDVFIKYLFGLEDHKHLLLSFINAVQKDDNFTPLRQVELKNLFNIRRFRVTEVADLIGLSEKEIQDL